MSRSESGFSRLARFAEWWATPSARLPVAFWFGLYAAGLVAWVAFFRAGHTGEFYGAVDWPKERQYFGVIKQALATGTIPWHTSLPLQPSQPTDRFLAIPETLSLFAPQTLGLLGLSLKDFVLLNHLVMYTIGLLGWYAVSGRGRFPPWVAATGFALLAFNGNLVAHIAAGHTMWSAYYWVPWFILPLLDACERPPTLRQAMHLALVLGAMVLQGGCHLYIWCLLFLGVFLVVNPWRHRMIAVAAALSGLLAAHRFGPAALTFHGNVHRLRGFESGQEFWNALLSHRLYARSIFPWEFDSYIGLAAALFVGVALALPLILRPCRSGFLRYVYLLAPAAALIALAFRAAPYWILNYVPIPLLDTQRVPSRLLLLPLAVTTTVACVGATNLLINCFRDRRALMGAVGWGVFGSVVLVLARHAIHWSMAAMESVDAFRLMVGERPIPAIVTRADPSYVAAVYGGWAISALALLGIVWWLMRTGDSSSEVGPAVPCRPEQSKTAAKGLAARSSTL